MSCSRCRCSWICTYRILWTVYHQRKSICRSFSSNSGYPYVCKCYKHYSNSSSIDSKRNSAGNLTSFYDGSRRFISTRIFDSQKNNENQAVVYIFLNNWFFYDTIRILFQPNILEQNLVVNDTFFLKTCRTRKEFYRMLKNDSSTNTTIYLIFSYIHTLSVIYICIFWSQEKKSPQKKDSDFRMYTML